MISSEDNVRKTSVFVLLMLRADVYAYTCVAAVLTGFPCLCLCLCAKLFSCNVVSSVNISLLYFITTGNFFFVFQDNKVSLKQAPGHNH